MSTPTNRTVNIYINQASAERSLQNLQRTADKMTDAIHKGEKAGKDMTAELEKLAQTKSKIEQLEGVISGKLKPSLSQVKARANELRRELEKMSEDAPGYAAKFEEFKKVSARFQEMQADVRGVGKALQEIEPVPKGFFAKLAEMKDQIKAVALGTIVGNTAQTIFEKVTGYFSGIVSGNAKLSDSITDISKATELADEDVKKLNTSLGKIDTRTATEELRNIAVGLGQIGEAATPEAIANIDKIVVALGDEFGGGAKEITTTLGILRNNLQDIKTGNYGEDVLHIGNALNELGAKGLATAPVIVDFADRMAGVASTFKLTSGQILGLSATLQELGVPVERGSTAVTKLLQKMAGDVDTFAKVAGVPVAEFTQLVNTDMLAAFTKVAAGVRSASGGNVAFAQTLQQLDADGSGAGEVISKLAANSSLLADKVNLASSALKQTSSITDEFNKKNTNLAATIEKLEKSFSKLITSRLVSGVVTGLVEVFARLVGVLGTLAKFIGDNAIAFGLWTVAIIANTIALRGVIVQQVLARAELIAMNIAVTADIILTQAAAVAKALFARNIRLARQEFLFMTAALKTNPLAILLTVAGAVALAFNVLSGKTKELTERQKELKKINDEIASSSSTDLARLKLLAAQTRDVKLSIDQRTEAAKKLQELQPAIFGSLKTEAILAGNVADAYQRASNAILEKAKSLVYEKRLNENQEKLTASGEDVRQLAKKYKIKNEQYTFEGDRAGRGQLNTALAEATVAVPDFIKKLYEYNSLLRQQDEITSKIIYHQQKAADITAGTGAGKGGLIQSLIDQIKALDEARPGLKTVEEINKSLVETAKLQAQLDHLLGKESKGDKSANKAEKKAEEAAEFLRKLQQINDQLYAASISDDEAEVQRVHKKYQDLLDEAKKHSKNEEDLKRVSRHIQEDEAVETLQVEDKQIQKHQEAARKAEEEKTAIAKKGSDDRLALAKKAANDGIAQIKEQHEEEMRLEKLKQQAKAEIAQKEKQLALDAISAISGYVHDSLEAELDEDRYTNNQKQKNLQKQLDSKRISQAQYNRQVDALNEDQLEKEREIRHRQFIADRNFALATAFINGALGVTEIWAKYADAPYYAAVLTGIEAAAVGLQIGAIASRKEPKYARGRRPQGSGGVPDGPSHAAGGIALVDTSGRKVGEMEGDEAILSKATYANNRSLVDALLDSSMNAGGRPIRPAYLYQQPAPLNYARAQDNIQYVRMYGSGGIVNAIAAKQATASAAVNGGSTAVDPELKAAIILLNEHLAAGIATNFVWTDFKKMQKQAASLEKTASLGAVS